MAKLIKCKNCGTKISNEAEKCPHCGAGTVRVKVKVLPCRSCGKFLPKDEHLKLRSTSIIVDGNSNFATYYIHIPCPFCGDKEPLSERFAKRLRNIFFSILIIVSFYIYNYFHRNIETALIAMSVTAIFGCFAAVSFIRLIFREIKIIRESSAASKIARKPSDSQKPITD